MMKMVMMMMMIWMMGGPLHCLIKPTEVSVVLCRLHVALAKAGSRLRRYKMWRQQRFRWWCVCVVDGSYNDWWMRGGSITFVLRGPEQRGEVPPPPWGALSLRFGPDQQKFNTALSCWSNLTIEENNEQPSKSDQSAILLLRVNVNLDSLKIPIPATYYHHLVVDSDLLEDEREHSFTGGQ